MTISHQLLKGRQILASLCSTCNVLLLLATSSVGKKKKKKLKIRLFKIYKSVTTTYPHGTLRPRDDEK